MELFTMNKKQTCTPAEIAGNICAYTICCGTNVTTMLKTLHISKNLISEMNSGRYPRIDTLYKIANYLGCTVNDLVYKD